jgi:hypothetical protein
MWDNQKQTWGVDPEVRNFVGLMGEMAFAEYADLTIDSSIVKWSDGGYDFHVLVDDEPLRIDVKTAQKKPPSLMVKGYAVNADYYILGHLQDDAVTFYGGASKERVVNGVRKESYRFGHTNYTLGAHCLDPLPEPTSIESITETGPSPVA